ncbi:MAG: hypothetical protein PHQ96_02595 [Candidatus Omnitrophica bacterium]|nr:hypothetical protein [Candidatus Omnitrophota bacterium]
MFKKVEIALEETLLQELDAIVHKVQELSNKGYSAWSVSREDLIRFAIASTFGLAYPYISIGKKATSKANKVPKKGIDTYIK